MPPSGPSDATAVEAYWLWSQGWSYRAIAAKLAGPPHHCKSHSTAIEWVERGRVIEARNGGPLSRTKAQRERMAAAIDNLRVTIHEDVHAGRLARGPAYRLLLDAQKLYIHLMGLPKAPEARTVNVHGTGTAAQYPAELAQALAAIPQHEWPPLPDRDEE